MRGQVKDNSALSVHGTYEENGTVSASFSHGTYEANDETYAEKVTLSEKARPPSIRGLREAVGERTSRNHSRAVSAVKFPGRKIYP